MSAKNENILINDIFHKIRAENKRLQYELSITKQFIDLCQSYRNFIKTFINFDQNQFNRNKFDLLENEFKVLSDRIEPVLKTDSKQKSINNKTLKRKSNSDSGIFSLSFSNL